MANANANEMANANKMAIEERIDEFYYDDGLAQFVLIHNDRMIGQIQTVITESEIITAKYYTRSTQKEVKKVISITSLTIETKYQNQGLGIKLLLYCLMTLMQKYPDIQYSVLDDCSNHSNKIKTNIYHKLGYYFTDHTSLQNKNKIHSLGPEKQVFLQ
jgi:ribosomal protein S18 acetylase RimI-like enzyme